MRLRTKVLLAALLMPVFALAQTGSAVVGLSALNLRSAPDYESSLETQMLMGAPVTVLEKDGYWWRISGSEPRYEGWTTELCLVEMDGAEMETWLRAPKYVCTAEVSHVLEKPSDDARRVCDLVMGDVLGKCLSPQGRPVRCGKFLKVFLPSGEEGYVHRSCLSDREVLKISGSGRGEDIAALACSFAGVPYLWGGNTVKGFDCSGLVWLCYHMNGIEMPRNASAQAREGVPVGLGELLPGDLVFFGRAATEEKPMAVTHVAISLGGQRIVQASQLVRINSLDPSDADYYDRQPLFARRIISR